MSDRRLAKPKAFIRNPIVQGSLVALAVIAFGAVFIVPAMKASMEKDFRAIYDAPWYVGARITVGNYRGAGESFVNYRHIVYDETWEIVDYRTQIMPLPPVTHHYYDVERIA